VQEVHNQKASFNLVQVLCCDDSTASNLSNERAIVGQRVKEPLKSVRRHTLIHRFTNFEQGVLQTDHGGNTKIVVYGPGTVAKQHFKGKSDSGLVGLTMKGGNLAQYLTFEGKKNTTIKGVALNSQKT